MYLLNGGVNMIGKFYERLRLEAEDLESVIMFYSGKLWLYPEKHDEHENVYNCGSSIEMGVRV